LAPSTLRKKLSPEFVRFVVSGFINTALTYVLFAGLSTFMHYNVAYTLVYIVGIVLAYVLNTRFVFKTPMHWKSMLAYPLVYVIQYGVSIVLLPILIEMLKMDRLIAAAVVIVVTLPISFLASRLIIRQGNKNVDGHKRPPDSQTAT
jgi:putative flippase GtrA